MAQVTLLESCSISQGQESKKLNKKTVEQTNMCEIDLVKVDKLAKLEDRKKVRESRADIWQAQKDTTQNQIEWLEKS